jgi:hypothetical protein
MDRMKIASAGLLALALMTAAGAASAGLEPVREGQQIMISRAVFAEGKLWLLTDAGQLFAITEGKDARAIYALPEPALDLWVEDGKPAVLTCERQKCAEWTWRRLRTGEVWMDVAKIAAQNDHPLAAHWHEGTLVVVSTHRIVEATAHGQTAVRLIPPPNNDKRASPFGAGRVAAVLMTRERILVGMDAGEWGGGLRAVDRASGRITKVESKGETRNDVWILSDNDPVNALVKVPWHPGCVAAAVGLVHMGSYGRIAEICGDEVRRLYSRPFAPEPPRGKSSGATEIVQFGSPTDSVAFFGMIRAKDALLAAGIDGIYRIADKGVEPPQKLPEFQKIGGFRISYDIPGAVLVMTEINARASLSGATPMIVPR